MAASQIGSESSRTGNRVRSAVVARQGQSISAVCKLIGITDQPQHDFEGKITHDGSACGLTLSDFISWPDKS
jgi:hypothetical protein